MWGPTLNALSQRRGGLLAVTSYSPGELVREEKLLRRLWPLCISPASPDLKEILLTMRAGQRHTLQRNAGATTLRGEEVSLKRGDVLEFVSGAAGLHVVCRETLLYVGPNLTPGRNRNFGKLLLRMGLPAREV
ncbi:1a, partial [Symbiodinium necroappetens]